ncbi:MAG TPA: hypothetical protein VFM37_14175, partial [Pseudonocardiaceae bacterium]|nr:hypothetical protein [Pseudonocardiaceae bacterium]
HCLPFGSVAGQGLLLQPLDARPHHVVTLPRWDTTAFFDAIERHRPTQLVLVPAQAERLVAADHRADAAPPLEAAESAIGPIPRVPSRAPGPA